MIIGTVVCTIRADTSAFVAAMESFDRAVRKSNRALIGLHAAFGKAIDRRIRHPRGFHPEQPHRSAMHTAYRAKTRRRGRR